MRRRLLSFVMLLFFVLSFSLPLSVSAAGFVPCGRNVDDPATAINETATCTLCHVIVGGKGVMDWGMRVMVAIGLVVITAMGIWYIVSAGDKGMIEQAKSGIKSTLIGVAAILGAWLLVNTVLLLVAQSSDASQNPTLGLRVTNGFHFSCDTQSLANTGVSSTTGAGTGTATSTGPATGGGALCTDPVALKSALAAGKTVCAGDSFSCPSICDTSRWNGAIAVASAKYGVAESFIKLIISKESACNPTAVGRTGDCGLMQVKPSGVGNTSCLGPAFNLTDPDVNIDQGTKFLAAAFSSASSLLAKYGATTTKEALVAAQYNGGAGNNASSVDCKTADGWPVISKWGCPINPGEGEFNACAIRRYACSVQACF